MSDKLKVEGVFAKGYGIIPKLVMQDRDLTIEAKSIYAYFASYAGNGTTAFPSVSKIIYDLNIGEERFYKHRKKLIDKGYVLVKQQIIGNGKFNSNLYTLPPYPDFTSTEKSSAEKPSSVNRGTNNNIFNNNNINSNSINNDNNDTEKNKENRKVKNQIPDRIKLFYHENFGEVSNYIQRELSDWVNKLSSDLVLEALKRTKDYGKEFGYAKRIMNNWKKLEVKTLDDVRKVDKDFLQKKGKSQFKGKDLKMETLPEWAKEENKIIEEDKATNNSELELRLKKLREKERIT